MSFIFQLRSFGLLTCRLRLVLTLALSARSTPPTTRRVSCRKWAARCAGAQEVRRVADRAMHAAARRCRGTEERAIGVQSEHPEV